ncbi:hypothetical protein [Iodobacter ciconiae]|uniref:Uncharacterized protein n=1 Tax=Iodobacter ciconiae TaxID=2496266 RepID=A0A3S8ZWM3_9NEIS|nr:hypothetical protein [Iodobacter ciconiae]AZN37893.1 hypothetical protein EJO50_16325 [Iodobacter ciconiae]
MGIKDYLLLFVFVFDYVGAENIIASRTSESSLSFSKEGKSFLCKTKFRYKNFNYSNDGQFLIFYSLEADYKNTIQSGFVDLLSAYENCSSGLKLGINPAPKYELIVDVNKKSNILITKSYYLYKTGAVNNIDGRWLISVWRYKDLQPIIFPFSPLKNEYKYIYRSELNSELLNKGFVPPTPMDNREDAVSTLKVNFISDDGKYIAPVGVTCSPFLGEVWDIEIKEKVSFDGLDENTRALKCSDIFK